MVTLLEGPRKEARKKGAKALASWVGTGALAALAGSGIGVTTAVVIGALGAGLSLWLTWSWLSFRGKWGLRF